MPRRRRERLALPPVSLGLRVDVQCTDRVTPAMKPVAVSVVPPPVRGLDVVGKAVGAVRELDATVRVIVVAVVEAVILAGVSVVGKLFRVNEQLRPECPVSTSLVLHVPRNALDREVVVI